MEEDNIDAFEGLYQAPFRAKKNGNGSHEGMR